VKNLVEIGETAAEIWRFFDFFQDGGRPDLLCVSSDHEGHLVVFVAVQNLVGIGAVVLIMCMFFDFTNLA